MSISNDSYAGDSVGDDMRNSNIRIEHDVCDCEPLHGYAEGGYHPVVIGDLVGERYEIIHKLGFGGTSTVWLARDKEAGRNIALKIFTAKATTESGDASYGTARLICALYDSLTSESLNGRHLCLVLGLYGPSLTSILRRDKSMKIRSDVAQQIGLQLAQGLSSLHKAGIIYHDLTPSNVLLQLDDTIATMPASELYKRFGQPVAYAWSPSPESQLSAAHCPTHLYDSLEFSRPENLNLVRASVKFVDLAQVGYVDQEDPESAHGVTLIYTDPETMWWQRVQTQASDIWSFACIIFELRACDTLIVPGDGSMNSIRGGIIDCLGALPNDWWERIKEEARANGETIVEDTDGSPPTFDFSDVDFAAMGRQMQADADALKPSGFAQQAKTAAKFLKKAIMSLFPERPQPTHYWTEEGLPHKPQSLEDTIRSIGTWTPWCHISVEERMDILKIMHKHLNSRNVKITRKECDTGEPPHEPLSDEEAKDFLELLSMMLTWERDERASLEDVLKHRWFTTNYAGEKDKPWVLKFHRGYQYWSNGRPLW